MTDYTASFNEPSLLALFLYWDNLRGDRRMPSRRDIDPTMLPKICFPNIFLVDFLAKPPWVQYRLAGDEFEARVGQSMGAKTIADLPLGSERQSFTADFLRVRDEACVVHKEHRFIDTRGVPVAFKHLILPLSATGVDVTGALGVTSPFYGKWRISLEL